MHDDGGNGVLTSVLTYHGLDDIRAMTPREFRDEILDPFRQEGVATLVPPEFGRVNAAIDTAYDESNRNQVLKLSFPTACKEIKVTACPGWAHRPSQIFDNIKQVSKESVGNITQVTVQTYGNHILYACQALGNWPWNIFVASHFYTHLAEEIKDHLSQSYSPGTIARDRSTQTRVIQRLLILATGAEHQIESTRSLITTSTQLALHANNVSLYGQVHANAVMSVTAEAFTASSITL